MYFQINACSEKHLVICGHESTMIADKLHVAFLYKALHRHQCLPVSKEYLLSDDVLGTT